MKTKIYITLAIAMLFYGCQKKDWTESNQNDMQGDSVEISGVDNEMLREWFSLNRQSDSIRASAKFIITQKKEEVESHPQDEREYMSNCINEAQQHLDQLGRKLKYIKAFAAHIDNYDPSLQHKIDSLKQDYIQEQVKLQDALKEL